MPSGAAAWSSAAVRRLAAGGLLLLLAAGVWWICDATLQQDLAAYYTAGAALAKGLDPYRNYPPPRGPWDGVAVFQHSRFLYPPLMAVLFRPLAALPYLVAKTLFTALSAAALLLAVWWSRLATPPADQVQPRRPFQFRPLAMAAAAAAGGALPATALWCVVWPPVFLVFERGQLDLLLLAALTAAWRFRRRPMLAGSLLGVAIMGKPLVLGELFLLVVGRHFRWAAATALALGALAVLNVALVGAPLWHKYLTEVLPRAAQYGEGGTEEMLLPQADPGRPARGASQAEANEVGASRDDNEPGQTRLNGTGRTYREEVGTFPRNASLPRLLAGAATPSLMASALLFLILALPLAHGARRAPDDAVWYWGGLLAALVAAPLAWAMELVWALPLLQLLLLGDAGVVDPTTPPPRAGIPRTGPRRATGAALALAMVGWLGALAGPFLTGAWSIAAVVLTLAAIAHLFQVAPERRWS